MHTHTHNIKTHKHTSMHICALTFFLNLRQLLSISALIRRTGGSRKLILTESFKAKDFNFKPDHTFAKETNSKAWIACFDNDGERVISREE